MRKILMICLTALLSYGATAQIKYADNSFIQSSSAMGANPAEWPTEDSDGNRNPKQALIIVNYSGFPAASVAATTFDIGGYNFNKVEQKTTADGQPQTWLYVPLTAKALTVKNPEFGTDRLNLPPMTDKTVYAVKLMVDKKMTIDVFPQTDDNRSISVTLDNTPLKSTPTRYTDVSLGQHQLSFIIDGKRYDRTIEVTPTTTTFGGNDPAFDFRKKETVKLLADRRSKFYVDDELIGSGNSMSAQIAHGPHTVKAIDENDAKAYDEKSVMVDGKEALTVNMRPRHRRAFMVRGVYNGSPVVSSLYVNGEEAYKYTTDHKAGDQVSYTFELPVGEKFSFKASNYGNEGNKTITVSDNMPLVEDIVIKRRRQFVWPWERDFRSAPMGFGVSYVRKQFEVVGNEAINEDFKYKGDLVWDSWAGDGEDYEGEGKWLNGIRAGIHFQPTFGFGLGIYTGLFWEYYQSSTDKYKINDDETSFFSRYNEHSLYAPVQMLWQLPFSDHVALMLRGGIGLNYILSASYGHWIVISDGMESDATFSEVYGNKNFAFGDKFSMSWELGVNMRFGPFMVGYEMSNPLMKSKVGGVELLDDDLMPTGKYSPELKTSFKRMAVTVSYLFSFE